MKMIYLANAIIPTEKAHGLQIMKMCEAFSDLGHKLELWIPRRYNSIKKDSFFYYAVKNNFRIKKIWNIDFYPISFFSRYLAFLIQSWSFVAMAIFLLLVGSYKKKGIIFYSRDYVSLLALTFFGFKPIAEVHDYRTIRAKWVLGFIFKKARKIITNSTYTRDRIIKHYKISKEKFLVAPNGVDTDFFNISESKEEVREKFSIPQDKTIIAYIGQLETMRKEKGVGDIIKVFNKLIKDNSKVWLYIIGGAQELVEKYRKLLYKQENVTFTGQVEHSLIPEYLRAVDIVVIPLPNTEHHRTLSPIKVFEFMAAGKVIVASDIPSLRDSLGDSAVFFEAENIDDLTQKLNYLIKNKDLRESLSKKILLESKNHSWKNRASGMIEFINSI